MMFTQYKLSPAQVSAGAVAAAQALKDSYPDEEPAPFAARLIGRRLLASPGGYLEFGPYWWAVKRALLQLGFDFGPAADPVLIFDYGEELPPYSALVAGETFRALYRETWLSGTRDFILDDDGQQAYSLMDVDMEARIRGLQSDRSEVDPEAGGPVLDAVEREPDPESAGLSPFSIRFAFELSVWNVDVYARSEEAAQDIVSAWEKSGRLSRAVGEALRRDEPIVDSEEFDSPLFVDPDRMRIAELARV